MATDTKPHTLEDKLFQYTKEKLFKGRKSGTLEEAMEKALGLDDRPEEAPEELSDEHWL
jgi:hypothetical protein